MLKIEMKNPMSSQFQLEYAVYMMLGSYFKKAECDTKRFEKKLFLYYQDLSCSKQETLEKQVISFVEKELIKGLGIPNIHNKKVTISLIPQNNESLIIVKCNHHSVSFKVRKINGHIKYKLISENVPRNNNDAWSHREKRESSVQYAL